jgi:hypothetical protein
MRRQVSAHERVDIALYPPMLPTRPCRFCLSLRVLAVQMREEAVSA